MTVVEAVLFVLTYGVIRLVLPALILIAVGTLAQRRRERLDEGGAFA